MNNKVNGMLALSTPTLSSPETISTLASFASALGPAETQNLVLGIVK